MISQRLEKALNKQLNYELYSAYLYFSMKAYFSKSAWCGFRKWMYIQAHEELEHAMGIYHYLIERCGTIELEQIDKPAHDWANHLEVFEAAYAHEKSITQHINELFDIMEEEKDRAAQSFLDWYLKEQVEEERNAKIILEKLKFIGDDKTALMLLNNELLNREHKTHEIK